MSSAKPKKFELRGDLGILKSGSRSDCDLIAGDRKFHIHKAILTSRGGRLEELLKADEQVSRWLVYIRSLETIC